MKLINKVNSWTRLHIVRLKPFVKILFSIFRHFYQKYWNTFILLLGDRKILELLTISENPYPSTDTMVINNLIFYRLMIFIYKKSIQLHAIYNTFFQSDIHAHTLTFNMSSFFSYFHNNNRFALTRSFSLYTFNYTASKVRRANRKRLRIAECGVVLRRHAPTIYEQLIYGVCL